MKRSTASLIVVALAGATLAACGSSSQTPDRDAIDVFGPYRDV